MALVQPCSRRVFQRQDFHVGFAGFVDNCLSNA